MKKLFSIILTGICSVVLFVAVLVIIMHFMGYKFYAVKSGSMEPTIPVGSVVLINENDTELEAGDIAMYQTESGTYVTHRVISVYPDGYQFRGDANNTDDIEEIAQSQIIGTYILNIPNVGYFVLNVSNFISSL